MREVPYQAGKVLFNSRNQFVLVSPMRCLKIINNRYCTHFSDLYQLLPGFTHPILFGADIRPGSVAAKEAWLAMRGNGGRLPGSKAVNRFDTWNRLERPMGPPKGIELKDFNVFSFLFSMTLDACKL